MFESVLLCSEGRWDDRYEMLEYFAPKSPRHRKSVVKTIFHSLWRSEGGGIKLQNLVGSVVIGASKDRSDAGMLGSCHGPYHPPSLVPAPKRDKVLLNHISNKAQ